MEYFRIYQYLTKGTNIKHLDRDLDIVKDRFDGNLFDILAASNCEEPKFVGVYISEESEETKKRIQKSQEWIRRNNGELYIVTEKPKELEGLGTIIRYTYRNGHRFTKYTGEDVLGAVLETELPEMLLAYLTKRSKYAKVAWQIYKALG